MLFNRLDLAVYLTYNILKWTSCLIILEKTIRFKSLNLTNFYSTRSVFLYMDMRCLMPETV